MKKILALMISLTMLSSILVTGCESLSVDAEMAVVSKVQEEPPVDRITARTADGAGVITMVMRTYDNALTSEDIQYIKEYTESLLDTVYESDNPIVISSPEAVSSGELGEARTVVYIYAAYYDGIPNSFHGTAGNEASCVSVYEYAQEWFIVELAGEEHIYF